MLCLINSHFDTGIIFTTLSFTFVTMNVIQCFASLCQGQDDMVQVRRLSHTMRGKMHSANKKLSMIRSKVMTMTVIKVRIVFINVDNTNVECDFPSQWRGSVESRSSLWSRHGAGTPGLVLTQKLQTW